MSDELFMKKALDLASKRAGFTFPNPCVGAVLVKNGVIVGEGYHVKSGADHAEVMAIKDAGKKAKGSTLYVTLEPCCHYGKTPPCTDAIIKSGIKKVFVAVSKDPNPLVCGKGIRILKNASISVACGLLEKETRFLIQPYLKSRVSPLPYVVLKIACTTNFKIAGGDSDPRWITSLKSRKYARKLRANYDAILTGIGTVLKDNPLLSAKNKPLRIILDSKLRIPLSAKVLRDKNVLLVATDSAMTKRFADFNILKMGRKIDVKKLLVKLGKMGIQSVFVEAGNALNGSFIKSGLVDKFYIFVAPKIFKNGLPAFSGKFPAFKDIRLKEISEDVLFECYRNLY